MSIFDQDMKKTLRHLKNTIRHPIAVLVTCICLTLFVALGFTFYGKADIAVFYPKTCLGGWQNVSHAEGEPQIEDNEVSKFNAENSAFLKNRVSQLYCGDFEGEIPDGNEKQQRIKLRFSWAAISETSPDVIEIIEIKGGSGENASQDTAEKTIILDNEDADAETKAGFTVDPGEDFSNSSLNSFVEPIVNPSSEENSSVAPAPEAPAPAAPADPAPEGGSGEGPTSFLDFLFLKPKQALAEEQEQPISDKAETTTTTPTTIETQLNVSSAESSSPDKEGLFEVLYTVNGSDWKSLGMVESNDLKNAEFELPLEDFVSWEDLSRLQVSLKSPSFADSNITTYVDGMSLEVTYGDEEADEKDLNGYKRKKINFSDIFELEKSNFDADEGIDVKYDVTQLPTTPEAGTAATPAPVQSIVEPTVVEEVATSTPETVEPKSGDKSAPASAPAPATDPVPPTDPAPEPVSISNKKNWIMAQNSYHLLIF